MARISCSRCRVVREGLRVASQGVRVCGDRDVFLVARGTVDGSWAWGMFRAREGHSVDALAPGGDEGRGTLRKAMGSREQALIRGYPNGATPPAMGIVI